MLIKAGVDISRLNREIRKSLKITETFVEKYGEELTITSTYEGTHQANSLHYANDAYDFDHPLTVKDRSIKLLKKVLGPNFDIVWKVDHIHIEYDPKGV